MPVNYRLAQLTINSFRGIQSANLNLPSGAPLHLIGSNNAGKSTILEALAFALRAGGFHQYDLSPFDFFRSAGGGHASEFEITISFAADKETMLPAVQGVGKPSFVHAVRVKGRRFKTGRMEKTFQLLDSGGKSISFSPRTPLPTELKDELKTHSGVGWAPTSARHDHIRGDLPDVMLLTPQNIHQSLFVWKTGPLKRLATMLSERFLADKWTFDYQGKPVTMPDRIKSVHSFLATAVEEFPFWKNDMRVKLSKTLTRYVGRSTQIELQPTIQDIEEWLTQQLLLSFAADEQGTLTPIDSMGDGWKSLIRLAALDVLSQFSDEYKDTIVLLFDEPETHLHPHLRRRTRTVLQNLAAAGWYVVTSTHSPELVDVASQQFIAKISRRGNTVFVAELDTSSASSGVRVQAKVNEQGNGEMFFANGVILSEGKDDEFALRVSLEKMGVDLDGRSISVVGVGGKGNIADYAQLLVALGTPWCAVTDEDRLLDGTYKPNAIAALNKINALKTTSDVSLQWNVDLEHCFGIGRNPTAPDKPVYKADPQWQADQIGAMSASDIQQKYPELAAVAEGAKRWIESQFNPDRY